ncbi:MAG: transcription elongation factor GreA [Gaiellaceae bacterium]|nr:transcription elongation factor GreA [Gaiellaceae bacterium]
MAARQGRYAPAMAEPSDVLTQTQRDALAAELAELEGPKRKAIVEAIATARGFGDLSENFEYHAAKNEQGLLEARIRTLRARLDSAVIQEEDSVDKGAVSVGSMVKIEDEAGEKLEVEISSVGGVSPDSPLGRALYGAREGDTVEVEAPRGSWKARVLSIRRA